MMDSKGYLSVNEIKSLDFIEIKDEEFKALRDFVYNNIGINLTEEKRTLLMGRLQKILRKYKMRSFTDYYNFLLNDKSGDGLSELADTISTNHTFFGREKDHFDYFLNKVLPEIEARCKKNNTRDIRVWSAGCSTGEEPYTLVMLMMEYFKSDYNKWTAGVLATDISSNVLEKAKNAIYSNERVASLPDHLKKKYFKPQLPNGDWEIVDAVKKEVVFRRLNLMNPVFPFKKQFDCIFCRNVMIYFDGPTRKALVDKFYQNVVNRGYLFIGHSETLKREGTDFEFILPAVYQKIL
eukprot:TRINITY_DN20755_c0_g1_i1.p1 TRINITY_DN20755_c0_g1~~TRINITY_DN20755_c0_g1_i1.p1  ORF type:complete len:294 (+),score=-19.03 TRINITY_DN20755_c0_g1_i1:86-967(+)